MDRQEYNEFVYWANNVFEEEFSRLLETIDNRIDKDSRVRPGEKDNFKRRFRTSFPQNRDEIPKEIGCVVKFRDSMLSSLDDQVCLMAKIFHNALHDLYMEEFDETEEPSTYENELKRRMVDALRETAAQKAQPVSQPTVTEGELAAKSKELRTHHNAPLPLENVKKDEEVRGVEESKGE